MDMKYIKNVYILPDTRDFLYKHRTCKKGTSLKVTKNGERKFIQWVPLLFLFFLNRLGITFGASLFIFTSLHIFIFGPLDLDCPSARSVLKALWGVCLRIAAQMIYKLDKGQKLRQGLPSPSMALDRRYQKKDIHIIFSLIKVEANDSISFIILNLYNKIFNNMFLMIYIFFLCPNGSNSKHLLNIDECPGNRYWIFRLSWDWILKSLWSGHICGDCQVGLFKFLGPNEVALVTVVMPAYLINSIPANMLNNPKRCHTFQSLIKSSSATSAAIAQLHSCNCSHDNSSCRPGKYY